MKRSTWIIIDTLFTLGIVGGVIVWQNRIVLRDWVDDRRTPEVPVAVTYEEVETESNEVGAIHE